MIVYILCLQLHYLGSLRANHANTSYLTVKREKKPHKTIHQGLLG